MGLRRAYVANLQVVVIAGSSAEASDGISELLHNVEERLAEGQPKPGINWLADWRYVPSGQIDRIGMPQPWTPIAIAALGNYEEGEVFGQIDADPLSRGVIVDFESNIVTATGNVEMSRISAKNLNEGGDPDQPRYYAIPRSLAEEQGLIEP
jgi:hypothetical protein